MPRRAFSISQCRHPNTWFSNLSSPILTKGAEEEVEAVAGDAAVEVTLTLASNNSNLLNNISQIPLPPQVPGQRPTMISDVLLDYPPQYVPQEGKKSLSATTLQERERTPCPHTLPERVRTPCFLSPQEGERTPCFHTPQEGVKTPCSHTPQEGVKTPCSHTPQEGVKTPGVQSHIVFIQDQVQNENNLKVGSRLKLFLPVWKNLGAHDSIQSLIAEGYKLPFRERPKLSRTPCITSGFADLNKQSALSTAIQDLIRKGAIDIVQKPDSLGFYSRLFLVPKPGNRWRPVIDLSCLNKFLAISKFKMETPELPSERTSGSPLSISRTPTFTSPFSLTHKSTSGSTTKASLTSSPAFRSA